MKQELLKYLGRISDEEQILLDGAVEVNRVLYSNTQEFVVDSRKMLQRRQLIDIRPHTRFVHFPKHGHNYIEIIYCCSGTMRNIIDDRAEVTLKPGELLFLNRSAQHEILPCGENDIAVNFIALPEFFDQSFDMVRDSNLLFNFVFTENEGRVDGSNYLHFETSDVLPVQNLAENMIWGFVNRKRYKRSINQSTMGLLILHLLNHTDHINRDDPYQYEQNIAIKLLKYIEENFSTAKLKEFASENGLPLYYLSKTIKKQLGMGYTELLQQRRLDEATRLLTQTHMAIEEIASKIGYENNSYFHRLFKARYETTPWQFRKESNEEGALWKTTQS